MTDRKLPTPLYAAAGAGEVVVEQLRKLPAKVDELRDRAKLEERVSAVSTAVRDNVRQGVETVRNLDATSLRSAATETATTLGEKAKEARAKAITTYGELVERGEHVAAGERSPIKVIATIAQKAGEKPTGTDGANGSGEATRKPAAKKAARKPAAKKS